MSAGASCNAVSNAVPRDRMPRGARNWNSALVTSTSASSEDSRGSETPRKPMPQLRTSDAKRSYAARVTLWPAC
ncbi:Uncharacterised protein [Mycobacteroides abscessus subsp. abscessus]|nr:Uncharacterised protein [Mycobacteroides abscessus subsp. abscessus]